MAQLLILKQYNDTKRNQYKNFIIAVLAAAYMIWAMIGSGYQVVFYGMMLIISSIPFYVWVSWGDKTSITEGAS